MSEKLLCVIRHGDASLDGLTPRGVADTLRLVDKLIRYFEQLGVSLPQDRVILHSTARRAKETGEILYNRNLGTELRQTIFLGDETGAVATFGRAMEMQTYFQSVHQESPVVFAVTHVFGSKFIPSLFYDGLPPQDPLLVPSSAKIYGPEGLKQTIAPGYELPRLQ